MPRGSGSAAGRPGQLRTATRPGFRARTPVRGLRGQPEAGPAGGSTVGGGRRAATQLPLSMRMKDDTGMTSRVRGVIARSKGEPGEVTTVLVAVQACGVCHTDLHYREGGIGDDFPYLLGHEAAGVVEVVGDGVTGVAPGDF